jgi:hypothetical protein
MSLDKLPILTELTSCFGAGRKLLIGAVWEEDI